MQHDPESAEGDEELEVAGGGPGGDGGIIEYEDGGPALPGTLPEGGN